MNETTCRCGNPTRDNATTCDTCCAKLTQALAEVPFLEEQANVTITRQRSAAIEGSSRSAEHGLPWHDKAAVALRNLRTTLVSWARMCHEEGVKRNGGNDGLPAENLPALSRYLLCRVDGLRFHDAGCDAVEEITNATGELRRLIFWKRKNRLYLGACEQTVTDDDGTIAVESCPGDVYADEGSPTGTCDDCGQGVTVVIRQSELNTRLDSRLCTPAEIATYAVYLGLQAKRESVRRKVNHWREHKRITQHGSTASGDPLFRYGEVRPLLYAHFAEKIKS